MYTKTPWFFSAVIVIAVMLFSGSKCGKTDEQPVEITEPPAQEAAQELFPDEADEAVKAANHNLTLTIISPEEEKIYPGQARMYEALAEGNTKWSNQVNCHWDFYLNENNEEVLYQIMDNTGILSGESKELCGFTSTFIDRIGKLRVVLTMTVYNAIDDNLETVTAERLYTVAR
ncbi:MAG TPA: hypothetical protein PKL83_06570 [bacterium]|nr:hypothetical protein [bacterium]